MMIVIINEKTKSKPRQRKKKANLSTLIATLAAVLTIFNIILNWI